MTQEKVFAIVFCAIWVFWAVKLWTDVSEQANDFLLALTVTTLVSCLLALGISAVIGFIWLIFTIVLG